MATVANLAAMGYYASSPEACYWLHQLTNLMVLSFHPPATRALLQHLPKYAADGPNEI